MFHFDTSDLKRVNVELSMHNEELHALYWL
jgi:hypothetical protein